MKKSFGQKIKNLGPAAIITSAFVGPGTITTCTSAGVSYGYALLWAIVFSGIALAILMEMSARATLASGKNFIDAAIDVIPGNKAWKGFVQFIVFFVVAACCFAFQAGNEIGAAAGLTDITTIPQWVSALIIGAIVMFTAVIGSYGLLEKVMQFCVSAMGILFVVAMIAVKPDFLGILKGIVPTMPEGSAVTVVALIGTTLVAMNLILHSVNVQDRYKDGGLEDNLEDARFDINVNVIIGVVVSVAIMITSVAVLYGTENGANNSATGFSAMLAPVLGDWARIIGDLGIFTAGISSAIAVAFTIKAIFCKLFHFEGGVDSKWAKILGAVVVIFGTAFAAFGQKPLSIIKVAQAISGFSLPFIAILLMLVTTNKRIMGEKNVNGVVRNILGIIAIVGALIVGGRGLYSVISSLF